MPVHQMMAFALAVTPLMLTPGVSATLVVHRVVARGRSAGVRVALGTAGGLLVHAGAAALGLAALVAASATAFTVVRFVGAAYLVGLGIAALRGAAAGRARGDRPPRLPWVVGGDARQAWLSNVLNPRAASVYLTLVPQFVQPGDNVLAVTAALVLVHILMQTSWLLLLTVVVDRAHGRIVGAPRLRRSLDRITGSVMIGLGARTALQGRS